MNIYTYIYTCIHSSICKHSRLPRACIIVGCMSKQASCKYSEYETSHTIINQHAHTHPHMHTRICANRFGAEIHVLTTHIFLCTHEHTHKYTHACMYTAVADETANFDLRLAQMQSNRKATAPTLK